MWPRSPEEIAAMVQAVEDPLSAFTRVNLNLSAAVGNNPVSNIDPVGLDFADCYADCIEKRRSPVSRCIAHIANAAGNKLAGPVKGGVPSKQGPGHSTTWQHKVGSKLGTVGSKIGKAAGHAAIALTIADGFHDLGLLGGCAAACAGE